MNGYWLRAFFEKNPILKLLLILEKMWIIFIGLAISLSKKVSGIFVLVVFFICLRKYVNAPYT